MLRPLWKNLVRLCSPVTRHHGTGRSCERELLSDVRSPLLHRMNQTTINLNKIKTSTYTGYINEDFARLDAFPQEDHFFVEVYCLGTIEQNPWKSGRGSQSQNTCPCASVVLCLNPKVL